MNFYFANDITTARMCAGIGAHSGVVPSVGANNSIAKSAVPAIVCPHDIKNVSKDAYSASTTLLDTFGTGHMGGVNTSISVSYNALSALLIWQKRYRSRPFCGESLQSGLDAFY